MFNIIRRFLEKNPKFTPAHRGQLRRLRERGQAVVITAVAFMAILAFMGLVTDVGTLYLNFTRLKRALDSAAVAAANNIKDSSLPQAQRKSNIQKAAREMLSFNEIEDISTMEVYTCTDSSIPTAFDDVCPDPGEEQRKLAWVQATQNSPLYFLRLFGINNIPITTHSIGEAATLDVVIVIDTSESMGSGTSSYNTNFDPDADCNDPGDPYFPCQPLGKAKEAAKIMVDKFFDGYDRVAVVNYDVRAHYIDPDCPGSIDTVCDDNVVLDPKISKVKDAIDAIRLHDDIDNNEVMGGNPAAGDINPLDGNSDGTLGDSLVTTCTGCGIRLAGNILKNQGRVDSVWIIVLLSDGATNMSDLPPGELDPSSPVPATYPNGFCGGAINSRMWDKPWCTDSDPTTRHCGPFHSNSSECPPGATWVGNSTPPYDAEDYARDMTDRTALLFSANTGGAGGKNNEPPIRDELSRDIAIYAIGLGKAAALPDYDGEHLLRYMANIGDDNARNPIPDVVGDDFPMDPCEGVAPQTSCGQYYYAPSPDDLKQIFETIAGSIFTRISE